MELTPFRSQCIQWGSLDNTSKNFFRTLGKPASQFFISDDIGSVCHLFQQFIQSSQGSDDSPFVSVSHLTQLSKVGSIAPFITDFNQLFFDWIYILILGIWQIKYLLDWYFAFLQNTEDRLGMVQEFFKLESESWLFGNFSLCAWFLLMDQSSQNGGDLYGSHIAEITWKQQVS